MPQPPVKKRGRGRPRKSVPTGTWIDSDVLVRRVDSIVADRDEREHDGPETYERLCRLTRQIMRKPLTLDQRDQLRKLARTAKRSVIVRQLVAWRHGLGERDVRKMTAALHLKGTDGDGQRAQARPRVKLIYR